MIFNTIVPAGGRKICQTVSGASFAVTTVFFCNTSTDAVDVLDVYLVAGGGSVGAQSKIVCQTQIKPTDTFVLDTEKLILENGDYLFASSINGTISASISAISL